MRIIVDFYAVLVTAGTGGVLFPGLFVGENDAIAAGAFPEAQTQGDNPGWLWRSAQNVHTDSPNDRSQATRFMIDLRAKRTLRGTDMSLVFLAELPVSSASVNLDGIIRTLWLKS